MGVSLQKRRSRAAVNSCTGMDCSARIDRTHFSMKKMKFNGQVLHGRDDAICITLDHRGMRLIIDI